MSNQSYNFKDINSKLNEFESVFGDKLQHVLSIKNLCKRWIIKSEQYKSPSFTLSVWPREDARTEIIGHISVTDTWELIEDHEQQVRRAGISNLVKIITTFTQECERFAPKFPEFDLKIFESNKPTRTYSQALRTNNVIEAKAVDVSSEIIVVYRRLYSQSSDETRLKIANIMRDLNMKNETIYWVTGVSTTVIDADFALQMYRKITVTKVESTYLKALLAISHPKEIQCNINFGGEPQITHKTITDDQMAQILSLDWDEQNLYSKIREILHMNPRQDRSNDGLADDGTLGINE